MTEHLRLSFDKKSKNTSVKKVKQYFFKEKNYKRILQNVFSSTYTFLQYCHISMTTEMCLCQIIPLYGIVKSGVVMRY